MLKPKKLLITFSLLFLVFTFTVPSAIAGGNEYDAIVRHLKTKYQAKKVKIPFMWVAKFAVRVVRPAGVKSFNLTVFEDLKFTRDTLDREMQAAMRSSFTAEWSPIFHVRSRDGEQVYMYMRESGKNVKIALVTIDKEQATVIRATFDPDKLTEFVNNPRIFGISLNDKDDQTNNEILKQPEVIDKDSEVKKEN